MKTLRVLATAAIAVSATLGLAACAPAAVLPPVMVDVNDLQGKTVEVHMATIISIDTASLPVDSYTAEIGDPSIVEFIQGREDGSATFNPGFKPLKVGETDVTLINAQGGIQPLEFTIKVVPAPAGGNLLGGDGR